MQTGKASTSSVARPSNILVRDPHDKDIIELSVTMRQEDKDEVWHLARLTPLDALRMSINDCEFNRAVLLDGQVVFMYGVGNAGNGVGVPWMLASPLLSKVRKQFIRECREGLEEMSQGYKILRNVAWSKNDEHIRWLTWLGFQFNPAVPMGPDGELYHEFYKVI